MKTFVAMLMLGNLAFSTPSGNAGTTQGNVTIAVFSCLQDSSQPPSIIRSADEDWEKNPIPVTPKVTSVESGIWRLEFPVPTGHWYIRLLSPHCGSYFATTSLNGEPRAFVTAMNPGSGMPIREPWGAVAGTLPFPGEISDIYMAPNCELDAHIEPIVNGRYFYFDMLIAGKYCLVISIAANRITKTVGQVQTRV